MAELQPPFVAIFSDCNVRYEGRARAEQHGIRLAIVAKEDGTLVAHALEGGTSPLFYNPAGTLRSWRRRDRLYVESVSQGGEILRLNGIPEFVHRTESSDAVERARRSYVRGLERDLSRWLVDHPGVLGLAGVEVSREVARTGGRLDLFFEDGTAVEVKRRATVSAYDQARRYLRDDGVRRVVIVCLSASGNLEAVCERDEQVSVLVLDPGPLPDGIEAP